MAEGSQAVGRVPHVYTTHGEIRGLSNRDRDAKLRGPGDERFEGLFGKMFAELPALDVNGRLLGQLADEMTAPPAHTPREGEPDHSENTGSPQDRGISAGYTYLAQFIDHDLSFDPASSFQRKADRNALIDYRTPRFDLDSLYGRGPADQPYLYGRDGRRFILGDPLAGNDTDTNACDVPRNSAKDGRRAIIGDPRNDENEIVSQLHAAMLRFHNLMADKHRGSEFEDVQKLVRQHYQWIVIHDFLPTVVNAKTLHSILPHLANGTTVTKTRPRLKFFNRRQWGKSVFMPVEFSVGAYRFGHSMIRPSYRLNEHTPRTPLRELFGFRAPRDGSAIDWRLFFMGVDPPIMEGPSRLQWAYKIDTSLGHLLNDLPMRVLAERPQSLREQSLAWRDLVRGVQMSLPSGQAVAQAMGEEPIPDRDLKIGAAGVEGNLSLAQVSRKFKSNAPLWFYVLAEAQRAFKDNQTPIRLGPVGGRIVAEVIVGLMLADEESFLNQPDFKPQFGENGNFRMWDLLEAVKHSGRIN